MKDVVALINLHNNASLGLLSENRPIASTTFLGRYAFIDFVLSNLTNSNISNIGILVKDHIRSITKHLSGKIQFLSNTKSGFELFFLNEKGLSNPLYNTDVNNILENDWFLYDNKIKYILVAPVNYILSCDYDEVIRAHVKSKKYISVLAKEFASLDDPSLKGATGLNVKNNTVDSIFNVYSQKEKGFVSLETYVFDVDYLKELLYTSRNYNQIITLREIIDNLITKREDINVIEFKKNVKRINSLEDYFNLSMECLNNEDLMDDLFAKDWPIYTITHNSRPTLYDKDASVKNSLVANGSYIKGTVKNSVLSRHVHVEEGAVVENSIIFTNTVIKKGVHLKNVISDKHCVINNDSCSDEIKYIPQGAKI